MPEHDPASGQDRSFGPISSRRAGAETIESLEALSESVRKANELALDILQMRPLDALALRHIAQGAEGDSFISPKTLGSSLRISSAAVTKLIDRLVESGKVTRQPNPRDRRSIVLVPAATVAHDLAQAYRNIHSPLVDVIDGLSDDELATVTRFASHLANALTATSERAAASGK